MTKILCSITNQAHFFLPDAWQNLLLNTEFLTEEEDRKPATLTGLLLFCANPNRFLTQAGIDAVAYPGKKKDYAAKEHLSIRGPMMALLGPDGVIENGLVEQTFCGMVCRNLVLILQSLFLLLEIFLSAFCPLFSCPNHTHVLITCPQN